MAAPTNMPYALQARAATMIDPEAEHRLLALAEAAWADGWQLPEIVDVGDVSDAEMDAVPWAGRANESRREAEFFETCTVEDPHGLRASACYARDAALEDVYTKLAGE